MLFVGKYLRLAPFPRRPSTDPAPCHPACWLVVHRIDENRMPPPPPPPALHTLTPKRRPFLPLQESNVQPLKDRRRHCRPC